MSVLENFRVVRWLRTINLLCQAVLFLTLFAGLNYLADSGTWREDAWRYDLTRYRRYSLSPESVAYLRELSRPVRIVVTRTEEAADPNLRGLLREYVYATAGNPDGRITVDYLDVDLNRRETEQLNIDQANSVVFLCGSNRATLTMDELYRYENQERHSFQGEQAITADILNVANAGRKKIYFLVGHGELRPDDVDPVRGLSQVRQFLYQRNFDIELLDLSVTRRLPADASVLIAADPRTAYTAAEEEPLRRFLAAGDGRLILLLGPGHRHGLDRLLRDWGVIADDDLIRDSGPDNLTEDGDLIISHFAPAHPVTQALLHSSFKARLRVGPSRSVRPDQSRAAGNGLDCVTLGATSTTAWGEVNPAVRNGAIYDPRIDVRPLPSMDPPNRLGIGVAAERAGARDNLPFSVRSGRLVVFGTGDMVDNARLGNEGVFDIFMGAVNWMAERDAQLNIPPRPIERFQLSLSPREHDNLRYSLLFALPAAAALLGLLVYWTRRS